LPIFTSLSSLLVIENLQNHFIFEFWISFLGGTFANKKIAVLHKEEK
jgi:hypothetical protein